MPLYYFHLRDGEDILLDPEGIELGSTDAIRDATLKEARALIASDAVQGQINLSYHIDVEDTAGAVVHCLAFEDAVEITRGAARS